MSSAPSCSLCLVLTEGKGNMEWVMEEGSSYKYPVASHRNEDCVIKSISSLISYEYVYVSNIFISFSFLFHIT